MNVVKGVNLRSTHRRGSGPEFRLNNICPINKHHCTILSAGLRLAGFLLQGIQLSLLEIYWSNELIIKLPREPQRFKSVQVRETCQRHIVVCFAPAQLCLAPCTWFCHPYAALLSLSPQVSVAPPVTS